MKRMVLIVLFNLFIAILLFIIRIKLIDMIDTNDNAIKYFTKEIHSIEDGLSVAEKRAKEWNKEAILSGIIVKYDNFNKFRNNIGIITYIYFIEIRSIFKITGFKNAECFVTIDMAKKAIINFHSYGGKNLLFLNKLSLNKSKINFKQIIKLILDHEKNTEYGKVLVIRTNNLVWMINLFSKNNEYVAKTYKIDNAGVIIDIF